MRINSLANNQIQYNRQNFNKNVSFSGIEKTVGNVADGLSKKAKKKDGFIVKNLNKIFHLDKHIAQGMAKLSQTEASKKLVDWTRQRKKGAARWCDIESLAITFFYMWNTWKSDKVDEDRKVPSMIQNGAVTIASSAAAALVDAAFDPLIDKVALKYMELEKTNPDFVKQIGGRSGKDFYGAIKTLKSNTVFAAVVRFIIPVMMVPVVGKIVSKINEEKEENQKENTENKIQQTVQNQPQPQNVHQNTLMQSNYDDDDDHDDYDNDHDDHDDNNRAGNTGIAPGSLNHNNIYNQTSGSNATENKFKALFA